MSRSQKPGKLQQGNIWSDHYLLIALKYEDFFAKGAMRSLSETQTLT